MDKNEQEILLARIDERMGFMIKNFEQLKCIENSNKINEMYPVYQEIKDVKKETRKLFMSQILTILIAIFFTFLK